MATFWMAFYSHRESLQRVRSIGKREARANVAGLSAWLCICGHGAARDGAAISLVNVQRWVLGAGVLAIAGLFQFSRLKYHCLDKCHTPLSFIIQHWYGVTPRRHAFLLGMHHGVFCVGCCWAIMLLMFVVGSGNVGWMLALGAVMGIEKNAVWGTKLSQPLGLVLITWGTVIVAGHLV
jgi:predicted metal-binding membrane protein